MTEDGRLYTDPTTGATIFDTGERPMPDPDAPPAPPAPQTAAPAAPATPLDVRSLVPVLEADADRHAAIARQHAERFQRIIQEGQADVAEVDALYAAGQGNGIRDVAALVGRQSQRQVAAGQALAAARQANQEALNEHGWTAAIELGLIPTAPSARAPASSAVPPVPGAPVRDEFGDLSPEDRRIMGLDEAEAESSQISLLDARTFGLA